MTEQPTQGVRLRPHPLFPWGLFQQVRRAIHCQPVEMPRIRVLGPLEADRHGRPITLGGPKQRAVLALLLADVGRVVSLDRMVDAIWGDTGEDMSDTVQVYVARLRKALDPHKDLDPPGLIQTVRPGYRISLDERSLDILDFDRLARSGSEHLQEGRPAEALAQLDGALALWRGAFAEDLHDVPAIAAEADRLDGRRHQVTLDTLECRLALGMTAELIHEAAALAARHPFDERLAGLQMRALYRAGRQADALGEYRRVEATLRDELGLQPGPELQRLELLVLEQADELSPSPTVVPHAMTTVRSGFGAQTEAYLVRDGEALPLLRAVTTIGRLPDRAVVLADHDVSRRHAEIRRTGEGFRLVDTGSTNGTRVNGRTVADHPLTDGDVITMGATEMIFRTHQAAYDEGTIPVS